MIELARGSCAKPGSAHNEDLYGCTHDGRMHWVLDGATTQDGPQPIRDARWLVETLSHALGRRPARSSRDHLADACEYAASQLHSTAGDHLAGNEPPPALLPVAAGALLRIDDRSDWIDIALAGNVSVWIDTGSEVHRLIDPRVAEDEDAWQAPVMQACLDDIDFDDEAFAATRRAMKRSAAQWRCRHGVEPWLLAPAARSAEIFVEHHLPLRSIRRLMVATDGFACLATYEDWSAARFLDACACSTPDDLFARLRAAERRPGSARRFPRTKRHDDATFVLLSAERSRHT